MKKKATIKPAIPDAERIADSLHREGSASSSEYQEGYAAGLTPDIYSEHNPYHRRSIKARDWMKGWMDGADKYIEAMPNH